MSVKSLIDTVGYGASYTNFVANGIAFSIHYKARGERFT
jgi:hypothetical protein